MIVQRFGSIKTIVKMIVKMVIQKWPCKDSVVQKPSYRWPKKKWLKNGRKKFENGIKFCPKRSGLVVLNWYDLSGIDRSYFKNLLVVWPLEKCASIVIVIILRIMNMFWLMITWEGALVFSSARLTASVKLDNGGLVILVFSLALIRQVQNVISPILALVR